MLSHSMPPAASHTPVVRAFELHLLELALEVPDVTLQGQHLRLHRMQELGIAIDTRGIGSDCKCSLHTVGIYEETS